MVDVENPPLCAVCAARVDAHGTPFTVMVENRDESSVWAHFCSWAHLASWTAGEEPDFDREVGPATLGDRVFQVGCLSALLLLVALIGLGVLTLVRLLF